MASYAREIYQKRMGIMLKNLINRIATLDMQIDNNLEAGDRVRYAQKVSQTRVQYAQVKEKLDELKGASQETWLDYKTGVDKAINILRNDLDTIVANQVSIPASGKKLEQSL